jgi:hypothetical protein
MPVKGAHDEIVAEVSSWGGVTIATHRFGGTEFRLGRRELGHIHGNYQADIPFPKPIRDDLVAEGKAEPHHILPESGWITFRLVDPTDVSKAIELFRLSYLNATSKKDISQKAPTV